MIIPLSGCKVCEHAANIEAGSFEIVGTMHKTFLDGGCRQCTTEDGTNYELGGKNITPLLLDGICARIVVRERSSVASICMT